MVKIAINGFGRIGRNALKSAIERDKDFNVVAINDLTLPTTLAYLLKHDSCYGEFKGEVSADNEKSLLIVNGKEIKILAERDPEKLPWKEMGVDVVLESTGLFTKREGAEKHIKAGAKKVVISAPATDEDITIVMGVNEEMYDPAKHNIISNASCTTNGLGPIAKVINNEFGVEKGMMTTVHSYTNDQRILDQPHNDLRRTRAAAVSLIPTTTGAAKAIGKVIPELNGKLNGMAVRTPTPSASLIDIVFEVKKNVTKEEVNAVLKREAEGKMKYYMGYTEEPLVSQDFKGEARSTVIDALSTMVVEGNLVKILSWYDNEWGYASRIVDLIDFIAETL